MFGWFHLMQGITGDLRGAAEIILKQNAHALKWAQNRFWEFGKILVHEHQLVPDRWRNDAKRADDSFNGVVSFDQDYGVNTHDAYHEPPVSLLLSLQLTEGQHVMSRFMAVLDLNFVKGEGDEDEEMVCSGKIKLIGQYGKAWKLKGKIRCRDEEVYLKIAERLPNMLGPNWYKEECENWWAHETVYFGCNPYPREVRLLFKEMVSFYLVKDKLDLIK